MQALAIAALVLLTVNEPTGPIDSHRVYIGQNSGAYFTFVEFSETNQFLISVTNNKVYLACSAVSYELGESELSSEIVVMIGQVQLGPTIAGPWSDYMSVPIQLEQPARFVRVRLSAD